VAWGDVSLGEIISVCVDAVEVNPTETYHMAGVYGFGRGLFSRGPLSGAETTYKNFHKLSEGMIVLSQLKAWEGAIAVVGKEHSGYFLSTQFPTFQCNEEVADVGFLSWYLRQSTVWDELRSKARGMGARRDTVSPSKFLALRVPLPPLDDQRSIANRLNAIQVNLQSRLSLLTEVEHDTDAMLQNAFKEIIDGVDYRPMAEVAPLVRREIKIEPNEQYTEIGIRSFYNGIFHRRAMQGSEFSWQKLFHVKANDLVFSNLMAWEKAIAIAKPEDNGCVGNHRMLTCEVDTQKATPTFLMFYFQTKEGFAKVVGNSPGSIARNKTLSSKQLPMIEVPVPKIEAQRRFEKLCVYVAEIRSIRASMAKDAEALIPAMLHEIFEGKGKSSVTALSDARNVVPMATAHQIVVDSPFTEAVLVGTIIKTFHEEAGQPLGNFRLQKAVYFARRFMGERALEREYLRKAAGPYNPTMRYSGGIKVALDRNWIAPAAGKYGQGHAPGSAIADAQEWIEKYGFEKPAAWVRDKFKFKSNDIWELLATVDYAMLALEHDNKAPNAANVFAFISADPEWAPKVERLRLSEVSIQNAMAELESLFVGTGGV